MRTVILLAVTICLLLSCSDSRLIEPDDGRVAVSGTVYATVCGWWGATVPYSTYFDRQATVLFTDRESDKMYEANTDNESRYSLRLPPGDYDLKTFSYHWGPQNHQFSSVLGDSIIDPVGSVQWYYPDTISVGFYYKSGDTLTQREELELIRRLNAETGNYLDIENASLHVFNPDDPSWLVIQNEYYIPIRDLLYPSEIEDILRTAIDSDTITYPSKMFAHLEAIACLFVSAGDDGGCL